MRRQDTLAFRALWGSEIDQAYLASNNHLLDLLVLNREVAALAGGPEGESYRRISLANTARIAARLGESPPAVGIEVIAEDSRYEAKWVAWLHWWRSDRKGEAPLKGWSARRGTWRRVREGCSLLSSGENPGDEWMSHGVTRDCSLENRVLSYLMRLLSLRQAEWLLAHAQYEEAVETLHDTGADGERLLMQARLFEGRVRLKEREIAAQRARYLAYRARRLAGRLELLAFAHAANYWRLEEQGWTELARFAEQDVVA